MAMPDSGMLKDIKEILDSARNKTFIYKDIRETLDRARTKAFFSINTVMVEAYWRIGKRIVEEERMGKSRACYRGRNLVANLSKTLTSDIGKGFSRANLWDFRQFYLTFPEEEKLSTVCREVHWSALRLIMRVESPGARAYYLEKTRTGRWSAKQLRRNINTQYFKRPLQSKSGRRASAEPGKTPRAAPLDFVKDSSIPDFLQLNEKPRHNENEIESAIIGDLSQFLLEANKGFSLVGWQCDLSAKNSSLHFDLIFYNYILKCFVLIDVKTDAPGQKEIERMDMDVRIFDEHKRSNEDNPTIGIILSAAKEATMVKFLVPQGGEQIFALKYKPVLPSEEDFKAELERVKRIFFKS